MNIVRGRIWEETAMFSLKVLTQNSLEKQENRKNIYSPAEI
jgi:hypothetical protein